MLRLIYICLLRLHPRHFQIRYADEMLWIFDESRTPLRLIADGLASLIRQWLLRPEPQPAGAVPLFASINDGPLPNVRILQGALATMALFSLLVYGFGRGGAISWRMVQPAIADTLYVTDHPLPVPLIRRPEVEQERSIIGALWIRFLSQRAEPAAAFATPLLRALDRNADGQLSADEIDRAPHSLATLDKDHSGALDPEECGLLLHSFTTAPSRERIREAMVVFDLNRDGLLQPHETPAKLRRKRALSPDDLKPHEAEISRLAFMLRDAVLRTLDDDRDGQISPAEIAASPAALRTLDYTRDGVLTQTELR